MYEEYRIEIISQVGSILRRRYPLDRVLNQEEIYEQTDLECMFLTFEMESYDAATSQSDYYQKLYLRLSPVESLSPICSVIPLDSARNSGTQEGSSLTKEMSWNIISAPLNTVSSAGSGNDSFQQVNGIETSDDESTATSSVKKNRIE